MTILSYARCSTDEQAKGLVEQIRRNRAVADLRGMASEIEEFVDQGVSGSIPLSHRPAGQRMLQKAKAGDVIVANKMDRLFRSASDALINAERFKQRGIDLILIDMGADPVTGNGTAKMFFGMLALVAEFERERIAERMVEGKRAKAAKSGHIGGLAPYGYAVEGHGKEAILVPLEHEQEVVRMAREMRRMRLRPAAITRTINERGLRNRQNSPFHIYQIMRIVDMKTPLDEVRQ